LNRKERKRKNKKKSDFSLSFKFFRGKKKKKAVKFQVEKEHKELFDLESEDTKQVSKLLICSSLFY
jgi:preprotein translocase subunit SecB